MKNGSVQVLQFEALQSSKTKLCTVTCFSSVVPKTSEHESVQNISDLVTSECKKMSSADSELNLHYSEISISIYLHSVCSARAKLLPLEVYQ